MAGWEFWAVALCLSGAVAIVLVRAARQASPGTGTGAAEADLAIYKDQMAEIERDLARGTINADEAQRLRAEVGKRVLEADRARGALAPVGTARSGPVAGLIALVLLPGAMLLYWSLGAPGYPDMALKPRMAALDAAIAGRPGQEAELATLGLTRDAALDARLRDELGRISDPDALREQFRRRFEAGEMLAAIRAQERLIAVLGTDAQSNDQANLALALVAEAQGYVSPEAEAALRESLKLDMGNELSRYLVGEMFLQGGRFDQAFRFWRPLAEGGNPGAPWIGSIRERIEDVAQLAGIPYALPGGVASGPTSEDMAAAGEMSPEDRQAMIEGMVAQLSDRLASEGGTVEDWDRLIRSLVVLERSSEAQAIYDEAKTRFEGRSAELSFLRLAAVESGLVP
jgi:cytochrome c-type biogenesis protein CcmH